MRTPVTLAGLLGGLCWIGAFVLDEVSGGGIVDALSWAGIALLAIAVLGAGAGLASRSATWLRFVAAVCFAALVGSVLEVLRDAVDGLGVDAVFGAVAVVAAVVALTRRRRTPEPESSGRRAGGSHAR